MDTEIDWQRELDRSFGTGEDAPVEQYVVSGRQAVRRRRTAWSAAGIAAAVVVSGIAWSLAPGESARTSDAPVATDPSAPADPTTTAEAPSGAPTSEEPAIDFLGEPATYDGTELVLNPRTSEVLERRDNPMGYSDLQGTSVGLRAVFGGSEVYSLVIGYTDGTSITTVDATGDFDGWLAGAVVSQHQLDVLNGVVPDDGQPGPDEWLELGPDGQLRPAAAGVVLQQVRTDVDLGEAFAEGTDQAGVLRVRVAGQPHVAVFRVVDGRLEVIPGGDWFGSLGQFADWAREQYASGGGLR